MHQHVPQRSTYCGSLRDVYNAGIYKKRRPRMIVNDFRPVHENGIRLLQGKSPYCTTCEGIIPSNSLRIYTVTSDEGTDEDGNKYFYIHSLQWKNGRTNAKNSQIPLLKLDSFEKAEFLTALCSEKVKQLIAYYTSDPSRLDQAIESSSLFKKP